MWIFSLRYFSYKSLFFAIKVNEDKATENENTNDAWNRKNKIKTQFVTQCHFPIRLPYPRNVDVVPK